MAMSYSGMKGFITLGDDRVSRNVRRELDDLPACDVNLSTCEAYVPTGRGTQTYARKLSVLALAPTLAKTEARRRRYGVSVRFHA